MPLDDFPRDVTVAGRTYYRARIIEHEGTVRCYALNDTGVPVLVASATLNHPLMPGRSVRAIETKDGTWRTESSPGCQCKAKGPLRFMSRRGLLQVGPPT